MKKQFASKEEQRAYYKAKQQKEAAREAARENYDIALNPARISPEILAHKMSISCNPNDLDFGFNTTVGAMIGCDGQPNQEFWRYWQTTGAAGVMKLFNPKQDIIDSGVRVAKNAAGKWTMIVNGTEAIGSLKDDN